MTNITDADIAKVIDHLKARVPNFKEFMETHKCKNIPNIGFIFDWEIWRDPAGVLWYRFKCRDCGESYCISEKGNVPPTTLTF
jgi:hypothetical protein